MFAKLSPTVLVLGVGFLGLVGFDGGRPTDDTSNDFAFLRPWFHLEQRERERLAQRRVVVRGLPAADRQIGVIAVCAVAISPEAFVARVRSGGDLKRGVTSNRFSDPPSLQDLSTLSLDEGDIDRLRRCRARDCRLNFADHEISAMQLALRASPQGATTQAQEAFRRVVLDRTLRYKSGGLDALPEYNDRAESVRPAAVFSEIVRQIAYLKSHVPGVLSYLERFPSAATGAAESSLVWSKVMINNKAVVMVTHVAMFRPELGPGVPSVLVARKQVYASRYTNGELMLTMLFAGTGGSPGYLLVVNRSQLDELEGMFSGMKRSVFEGRIKEEAAVALTALRDALERGAH